MSTVGDICEVEVLYNTPWGITMNSFGFLCVTNVSDGLANLANAFKTACVKTASGGLLYGPLNTINSTLTRVRDVKPGSAAAYELSYASIPGDETTGDPLPPQCALVISWRTDLAGRSYKGRTYLSGYSEISQASGVWNSAITTKVGTFLTNVLAVFGPAGTNGDWRLAVISRYANGVKRAQPVATQITSGAIRTTVFSQRRRVLGVGS